MQVLDASDSMWRNLQRRYRHQTEAVLLFCVLVAAVALRLHKIQGESLWLDEVYSATFAVQRLFDLIVAVWRFDTHPPLYYIQLHLWAMVSHNTTWLFLNSVLWSSTSVLSVWYGARRCFGTKTALLAAAILAVLPAEVLYSHQLRMYAMVTCLGVWCWHFTNEALLGARSRSALLLAGLGEVVITYSHMSGIVIAFTFAVYGLLLLYLARWDWRIVVRWVITQAVVAILGIPAFVNSAVRSLSHVVAPDLGRVAETLGFLVFGQSGFSSVILQVAAVLIFVTLVAAAAIPRILVAPQMRATVLALVLFPLLTSFVASYLLRPMWIERGFLFILPFLAISAAGVLVRADAFVTWRSTGGHVRTAAASALAAVLLLLLGVFSAREFDVDYKEAGYAETAQAIAADLRPGDVVYVPNFVSFWGIAWYLVGPDWGSPLAIQDSQQETRSTIWPEVLRRLGPIWRERLHLDPQTRTISWKGAQLVIGLSPPAQLAETKRLWLVERQQPDVDPALFARFTEKKVIDDKGLLTRLLER